jgi:HK97 family phage major capsid protein
MRPVGMRPVGMRPVGMRPVGMRPVGMRPVGMREDGTESDVGAGYLDPEEWSADVAALFCEYSAVLRLGGQLVFGVTDLPIPAGPLQDTPQWLPEPVLVDERAPNAPQGATHRDLLVAAGQAGADAVQQAANRSVTRLNYRRLRPNAHELTVQVAVRNRLVRSIVDHPDVAWAVKQDIAYALAFRADQGFLHGDPNDDAPRGISRVWGTRRHPRRRGAGPLDTARAMVAALRAAGARFANPGWVLHPGALDTLSGALRTDDPNDAGQLLTYDGSDGGTLLGYPYVMSAAAGGEGAPRIQTHFSSDWSQAWIGADNTLVTVDFSADVGFEADEIVIRAVTQHDFVVRTPPSFIYTEAIA